MSKKPGEVFKAAVNGDVKAIESIVKEVVDQMEPTGRTPLMQAATFGNNRVLKRLLQFGAEPDTPDTEKNTALHEACQTGSMETVRLLLEFKANIDQRNTTGDTPLHMAAYSCNVDIVDILLNKGAEPNIRNNQGQTPMQKLAENSSKQNTEEAKSILELLQHWRTGRPTKSKIFLKSKKEENVECLKEIKDDVKSMSKAVTTLVEKIDILSSELKTTSEKLQISEQKASHYEQQLEDLKNGITVMQTDMKKNGHRAEKKLSKLITLTESYFDNLCCDTNFNDRVFYSIFNKIASTVGSKPDCWKDLARKLFEGHNPSFVNDQINEVTAAYVTEMERAHECLLRWKVIMATQVHKLDQLQQCIKKLDMPESDMLCKDIEAIMDTHTSLVHQNPTGSLTEKGLLVVAKELGREWRELGIHLGFTNANLENFKDNYTDSYDRNHYMLIQWVRREYGFNSVKLGRLAEALKSAKRIDLAQKLAL